MGVVGRFVYGTEPLDTLGVVGRAQCAQTLAERKLMCRGLMFLLRGWEASPPTCQARSTLATSTGRRHSWWQMPAS